ncbi:MAG: hypothetical protein IPM47_09030 [Sphingobacteriales bacterium]|nr:MAG: hypothetical protein IPM47_09030 [Sphingobacteriales bacterium]
MNTLQACLFCLLFSFLCLQFTGCIQQDSNKNEPLISHPTGLYKTYQSNLNSFEINIPSDWEINEYPSSKMLKAIVSKDNLTATDNEYRENLSIELIPVSTVFNLSPAQNDSIPPFDINTFIRWFFDDLQLKTGDFKVIEIGETLINGKHAAQLIYSYNHPQEFTGELKAISFLYIHKNQVVIITCLEELKKFQKQLKKFEFMAQSIRHDY